VYGERSPGSVVRDTCIAHCGMRPTTTTSASPSNVCPPSGGVAAGSPRTRSVMYFTAGFEGTPLSSTAVMYTVGDQSV
jgi:hypothetical protein